jgi:cell fate (sporulation/competence/biofilm development) regulator YlbF (YheA/YmcA/DUF963 family)
MKKDALSAIEQKAQELCGMIVQQEGFAELYGKLAAFMEDEGLKFSYQSLGDFSHLLQQKQASGLEVTAGEIETFEKQREDFLGNPVARGFLEAQEEVQRVHSVVGRQLSKMFEVGRVPVAEDFSGECCNSGCGCE